MKYKISANIRDRCCADIYFVQPITLAIEKLLRKVTTKDELIKAKARLLLIVLKRE